MELLRFERDLLLRLDVGVKEDWNALHHVIQLGLELVVRDDLGGYHLFGWVGHCWGFCDWDGLVRGSQLGYLLTLLRDLLF